jgi:hypothetical protein
MLSLCEAEAGAVDARDLCGVLLDRARVLADLRDRAAAVAAGEAEPDDELIAELEIAERLAEH